MEKKQKNFLVNPILCNCSKLAKCGGNSGTLLAFKGPAKNLNTGSFWS